MVSWGMVWLGTARRGRGKKLPRAMKAIAPVMEQELIRAIASRRLIPCFTRRRRRIRNGGAAIGWWGRGWRGILGSWGPDMVVLKGRG